MLNALDVAFSEPGRLIDVLSAAESDAEASIGLQTEFGLTAEEASVVMDQRVSALTGRAGRSRRAEIAAANQYGSDG